MQGRARSLPALRLSDHGREDVSAQGEPVLKNSKPQAEADVLHPIRTLYCSHCGEPLKVKLGCGDRTCPVCRTRWYGYHYHGLLGIVKGWQTATFMTLTLKNIPDAAFSSDHLKRLRTSFSKLRKRLKGLIVGGFYVIQVTNDGKGWHLHLHVLFEGKFIQQKYLSDLWREITGDSWVVDIRSVPQPEKAIKYLLSDFLQEPRIRAGDKYIYNIVFKGRRLVQPFGKYRAVKLRVPFKCPKCGGTDWCDIDWLLGTPRHRCFDSS